MGLTWTAALQDLTAGLVLNKTYAELRTYEKGLLDGTASVPTATPGGVAGHALTYVGQFAQWFAEATSAASDIPAAWEHVLTSEVAYRFSIAVRREDAALHGGQLARAWQAALDSYANVALTSNTVQDTTTTLQIVRMFCIRHLVRLKPRVYVPLALIDQAARAAWEDMWYHAIWNFRVRNAKITILLATPTTPTIQLDSGSALPSGETFHSLVSPRLVYTTTAPGAIESCEYADSERMPNNLAATVNAGRPSAFTFEQRQDGSKVWLFSPTPDADYVTKAQIAIAAPDWTSSTSTTTTFAKLPGPFQTLYPDLVLGHVMKRQGVPGWRDIWNSAHDALDGLLDRFQVRGLPEQWAIEETDVYHDGYGISRKL